MNDKLRAAHDKLQDAVAAIVSDEAPAFLNVAISLALLPLVIHILCSPRR